MNWPTYKLTVQSVRNGTKFWQRLSNMCFDDFESVWPTDAEHYFNKKRTSFGLSTSIENPVIFFNRLDEGNKYRIASYLSDKSVDPNEVIKEFYKFWMYLFSNFSLATAVTLWPTETGDTDEDGTNQVVGEQIWSIWVNRCKGDPAPFIDMITDGDVQILIDWTSSEASIW